RSPVPERLTLAPGLEISRVLTGLWQVADIERGGATIDPEVGARAMERYVRAGLTTFDMADHYGSSELIAGHYRATRGGEVQTLTKWVPKPGPATRADTLAAVDLARTRLQTDRLDLLQFHTWTYDDPAWLDGLFHLTDMQHEGLIGAIGLTNVDTAHLNMALASGVPIVSNQVSFSLLDRRAANGLTDLCLRHGVHLLAYGTVAGGLLTERWSGREEPRWDDDKTPWSLNKYRRFIEQVGGWAVYQELLAAVAAVAAKHGVSTANVAARYVLDTPGVGGVIIGARLGESEHVDDTLHLFGLRLDEEDRQLLARATAALRPLPGDCGDEYRKPPFLTASGDLSHHLESLPAPYRTHTAADGRTVASSGTTWESVAGYGRAVRIGDRVLVSGTTAMHGDRLIGGSDAAAQTHFVIDKIEGSLRSLGASLADVVRTRIFLPNESVAEAVSSVHGQRLAGVWPANTLVVAGLVGTGQLVEIEAEAVVR
ncbi:MAG TPA: aldo/keto reductase, partial [Trueperaceae bacterium]|nr:aldo/keto reductase [Trueperaceae bacterium]